MRSMGPNGFSKVPESHSRISSEYSLFYLHMLNINRGSLHTKRFCCTHLSDFIYRLSKNSFAGPKSFWGFRETGPIGDEERSRWVVSSSLDIMAVRFWKFPRDFCNEICVDFMRCTASHNLYVEPNKSYTITNTAPITTDEIKTRYICAYNSFNIESKIWRRHFDIWNGVSAILPRNIPHIGLKAFNPFNTSDTEVFTKQYFNYF